MDRKSKKVSLNYLLLFLVLVFCLITNKQVYSCIGGPGVEILLDKSEAHIDFDKLKQFCRFKIDNRSTSTMETITYKSHYDPRFIMEIKKYSNKYPSIFENESIAIMPISIKKEFDQNDFREPLKKELELLLKNNLILNFTYQDIDQIVSLDSFKSRVCFNQKLGKWESLYLECLGNREVINEPIQELKL